MTHRCYGCDPANADRFARHDGGTAVQFPPRFEGPPGNVNGGMAVGALTCPALFAATATGVEHPAVTRVSARLHRGVPHSAELEVRSRRSEGGFELSVVHGTDALITGRVEVRPFERAPGPGDVIAEPSSDVTGVLNEIAAVAMPDARPFFEITGDHPVIGCFSCGPKNARGLHIYPRFAGQGLTWASWEPERDMVDASGAVAASIIAAALDCSSGICLPREEQEDLLRNDQFYLLGSLDVRYLRLAPIDAGGYHVVGRMRERDGRKFYGMSALFDGEGNAYAYAEAIWIIVNAKRSEALGPKA